MKTNGLAGIMKAVAFLVIVAAGLRSPAQTAKPWQFDRTQTYFLAVTGKTGLFSFAAHNHAVLAAQWTINLSADPRNFRAASIEITIPAASLVIDSDQARSLAGLGSGPGADTVRQLQQKMLGPHILDARQFAEIRFVSTSVSPAGPNELRLSGRLTLHGQTQLVSIPVKVAPQGSSFVFSGQFVIRQKDFGLKPESVAGGSVKVKNEVRLLFHALARPCCGP